MKRPIFYGWFLLPLCLTNIMIGHGVAGSFSVIFVSLLFEFELGRAKLSGVFSLYILVFFCSGALVGPLLDRIGPRRLIPVGSVLIGLGLFACSQATSPGSLYFFFGILTAIGTSCISWIPNSVIITNWFVRRRGMAVGIVMCGNGMGMLIFIPLTQYLIEEIGWRGAFGVLALIAVLVVAPFNAVFQRTRPEEEGWAPDGIEASPPDHRSTGRQAGASRHRLWILSEAVKQKSFWMICLASFCNPLVTFSITLHQVALVVGRGFEPMKVASALGFAGLFAMGGRIIGGILSDRIGRESAYTLFISFTGVAILLLFFLNPERSWILPIYVALSGLGMGVGGGMFPVMLADLFPGPSLGRIIGITSLFAGLGASFGSWFVGYLYDLSGNYSLGLLCLLLAISGAISFVWTAAPRRGQSIF